MDFTDPADRFEHWALLLTLRDKTLDRFMLEHPALDEKLKSSYLKWSQCARENFSQIEKELNDAYDLSEIEMLRVEVCACIIQGHWQGAVCLTSVLMEVFLKLALIYSNTDESIAEAQPLTHMTTTFSAPLKKYMGMSLVETINAAFDQALIDEATKSMLHAHRERFRNAFFHANMKLMFGDRCLRFVHYDFCTGQMESAEVPISEVPYVLGEEMWRNARESAIPYFKEIHALIRETTPRFMRIHEGE